MGLAARDGYPDLVSPRVARDISAIRVDIRSGGIGRGLAEEGGGPLRGGLTLMNRFEAVVTDPDVPFEIAMRIGAHDGWLVCEAITVSEKDQGTPLSAAALRSLALSLYMQRIREELGAYLGGGLVTKEIGRTENTVRYELPITPADWDDFAQVRRAVHASKITTQMAADAYLAALASPDPSQNQRPTAAAAEKLGASRGHISRLLSQARREGIQGLGPQRPPRAKKGAGDREDS